MNKIALRESMRVVEVCGIAELLLQDMTNGKIPFIKKENLPAVTFAFGRLVDRISLYATERIMPIEEPNGNGTSKTISSAQTLLLVPMSRNLKKTFRCGGKFARINKLGKCTVCNISKTLHEPYRKPEAEVANG